MNTNPDHGNLNELIDYLETSTTAMSVNSDEFSNAIDNLTKLYSLKEQPEPPAPPKSVSPDTIVMVLGNLLVTLIIVKYEQENVMTSKVLPFLQKLR